jgi:hypothetical protein
MGLEDAARQLARAAQQEGTSSSPRSPRWSTTPTSRSGPTARPPPSRAGRERGLTLLGLLRPWGTPGPYLRVEGQFSKQFTLSQLDLLGGAAALGLRLLGPTGSLTGEYAYSYQALDGRGYLADHRCSSRDRS